MGKIESSAKSDSILPEGTRVSSWKSGLSLGAIIYPFSCGQATAGPIHLFIKPDNELLINQLCITLLFIHLLTIAFKIATGTLGCSI